VKYIRDHLYPRTSDSAIDQALSVSDHQNCFPAGFQMLEGTQINYFWRKHTFQIAYYSHLFKIWFVCRQSCDTFGRVLWTTRHYFILWADNKTIATTDALTIKIAITNNYKKSIRMYQGSGWASTSKRFFECSWFTSTLIATDSGTSKCRAWILYWTNIDVIISIEISFGDIGSITNISYSQVEHWLRVFFVRICFPKEEAKLVVENLRSRRRAQAVKQLSIRCERVWKIEILLLVNVQCFERDVQFACECQIGSNCENVSKS